MFRVQRSTLALALLACVLLTGCVSKHQAGAVIDTTLGLRLSTPPPNAYTLAIGLHRSEYVVVPISPTNAAPDVLSVTDADVNPFGNHKVHRVFATGSNAVKSKSTANWITDAPREGTRPTTNAPPVVGPMPSSGGSDSAVPQDAPREGTRPTALDVHFLEPRLTIR